MADVPDAGRPSGSNVNTVHTTGAATDADRSGGGRNVRRRNRNKNRQQDLVTTRFRGKCEALGKNVYDSGLPSSNQDLFTVVTKAIGEYIAANYEDAEEFRLAFEHLRFPELVEPVKPTNASDVFEVELWKEDRKEYRRKQEKRIKNSGKAFALILGQCSRAIRDRVEAATEWPAINNQSDVLELLKLIRNHCTTVQQPVKELTPFWMQRTLSTSSDKPRK